MEHSLGAAWVLWANASSIQPLIIVMMVQTSTALPAFIKQLKLITRSKTAQHVSLASSALLEPHLHVKMDISAQQVQQKITIQPSLAKKPLQML